METKAAESYEETVERIRAENPGTEIWEGGHPRTGDKWIYRPSTPSEAETYRTLQAKAKAAEQSYEASYVMLTLGGTNDNSPPGCVLWPAKADLKKLLAKRPFLAATMAAEICDVSGMAQDVTQKKL